MSKLSKHLSTLNYLAGLWVIARQKGDKDKEAFLLAEYLVEEDRYQRWLQAQKAKDEGRL